VLAQTYQNWECIVVDDRSTDGTDELLASYCEKDARFQYHHRPNDRPKGANACRNYGFEISCGSYIYFLDSDDTVDQNIFEKVIAIYNTQSGIDFIFFNYLIYDGEISNIIHRQHNFSQNPFLDYFAGKINLATSAILWKRETISETRFNEHLKKSQELNFTFRLFTKFKDKPLIGFYLNENGYFLRKHDNSIVSNFHKLKPDYLLSEIVVRNQILKYFNKPENKNIYLYNRHVIEKSLFSYLLHSNLIDFVKILIKLNGPKKSLSIIKVKLIIYKFIYILSNRNYRFNKTIKSLYVEEFNFDYN